MSFEPNLWEVDVAPEVAEDVWARSVDPQTFASDPTPTTSSSAVTANAKRVLVVDDNVDAADMLGEMLGLLGHVVTVRNDPAAALDALASFNPDIAILDIGLPGMTGYELAVRMRQATPGADLTLVALTGYGQEQDRQKSATAGFNHHLVKPVDFDRLMKIIDPEGLSSKPQP